MPTRDYAKSRKRKGKSTYLILSLILLFIGLSAAGLYFLKEKAPAPVIPTPTNAVQAPKSSLPSRPEEVYSYIRDLETREIPVGQDEKHLAQQAKLNEKQEKLLRERKALEEKRLAEQAAINNQTPPKTEGSATDSSSPAINQSAEQELAQQKAREEEKRLAEEKRRKEQERKKQQELAAAKKKEEEKAKTKIVAKAGNPQEAPKQVGQFGLQCGAFKNKAQAENMQARLAMSGFNARINSSADWNRVVVGPVGDRAAASRAQTNARSVADCVIVGM
ncbi:cell division protein FtsN [Pasteurellaceae bacterium RH1A]|nr:cell division protein FtsN [Pasteurellaceae bacterium RH1A]